MTDHQLVLRHAADPQSACGAFAGGLSVEELALAREALALKAELRAARAAGSPQCAALERRAVELGKRRTQAWRRKMIALGHFPAADGESEAVTAVAAGREIEG